MRCILVIVALSIPGSALACMIAPGAEEFQYEPSNEGESIEGPYIELDRLQRGYDDGNYASCSDAGRLVFFVEPDLDIGYKFSLAEGSFPDLVFPEFPVQPVSHTPGEIRFVWLDFQGGPVEPIDVVVEVRAVSAAGARSDPVTIEISDPGGS